MDACMLPGKVVRRPRIHIVVALPRNVLELNRAVAARMRYTSALICDGHHKGGYDF